LLPFFLCCNRKTKIQKTKRSRTESNFPGKLNFSSSNRNKEKKCLPKHSLLLLVDINKTAIKRITQGYPSGKAKGKYYHLLLWLLSMREGLTIAGLS
jgi:hypothetical protein